MGRLKHLSSPLKSLAGGRAGRQYAMRPRWLLRTHVLFRRPKTISVHYIVPPSIAHRITYGCGEREVSGDGTGALCATFSNQCFSIPSGISDEQKMNKFGIRSIGCVMCMAALVVANVCVRAEHVSIRCVLLRMWRESYTDWWRKCVDT